MLIMSISGKLSNLSRLLHYSLLLQVSLVSAESFDNINTRQLFNLVGSWRVSINPVSQCFLTNDEKSYRIR